MERVCQICGRKGRNLLPAAIVRPALTDLILKSHPDWSADGFICTDDLSSFRDRYIQSLLADEKGELSSLESEVVRSLRDHETLASDVDSEFETRLSLGERLSDRLASFGGSWGFILAFGGCMVAWIGLNSWMLARRPFDPFPYILLNLVLSCLAALQAPVIMMSQNRQEAKDRMRSAHDYQVNLKAELEIRQLHQKVDHLLRHQWERLIEIQQIQVELMNELRQSRPGRKPPRPE